MCLAADLVHGLVVGLNLLAHSNVANLCGWRSCLRDVYLFNRDPLGGIPIDAHLMQSLALARQVSALVGKPAKTLLLQHISEALENLLDFVGRQVELS